MAATDDTPRTRITWDYAPAPESADHVRLRDSYGLFIGGEFVDAARRAPRAVDQPGHRGAGGRGRLRRRGRRRRRRRGRARRRSPSWAQAARAASAAKYLFRIARLIQERARELAVVESLDGGKPIRESRDVDIPLAAAHFFYYAGWADKLAVRRRRARGRAARRRRADRAVELPAADGGLEARARAGVRQHRGPQAGRDDAADRAAAGRDLPGGRAARRRGEHRHRRRGRRAPRSCAPDVDKVAFTGSTAVGKDIQARARRAAASGSRSSSAASRPTSSSRTPRSTRRSRASSQGIFFNQGHVCCAGLAAAASRSRVADEVIAQAVGPHAACCASATRSTRTPTSARSTRAEQLERIEALVAAGERGGRGAAHDRLRRCPSAATGSRRRSSPTSRPRTASRSRRSSARSCRC